MTTNVFLASFDNREVWPSHIFTFLEYLPCDLELAFLQGSDMPPARFKRLQAKVRGINDKVRIIDVSSIDSYIRVVELFDSRFINYSTGGHDFEKACFHRWFALNACTSHLAGSDYVCLLDTDFFLGITPSEILRRCLGEASGDSLDFVASWSKGAGSVAPEVAIMTKSALLDFCRYVLVNYFSIENRQSLVDIYFDRIGHGLTGGVCDMTALASWMKSVGNSFNFFNLRDLLSASVISNLNVFVWDGDSKNMFWRMQFLKGQGIKLLTNESTCLDLIGVHFQGSAKEFMPLISKKFCEQSGEIQEMLNSEDVYEAVRLARSPKKRTLFIRVKCYVGRVFASLR